MYKNQTIKSINNYNLFSNKSINDSQSILKINKDYRIYFQIYLVF